MCVMRRLFPLIACLLAVLWLPATLHCGLETAGLLDGHHGEACADTGCATACTDDGCAAVEDGNYKVPSALVKAPSPVFVALGLETVVALTLVDAEDVSPVLNPRTDPPLELARTWQFAARTALLPGAPYLAV